jgi:N-acetylneuraminic acid mutarotase
MLNMKSKLGIAALIFAVLAMLPAQDARGESFGATDALVKARVNHTETLLPNGKVLVVGGGGYNGFHYYDALKSVELYDADGKSLGEVSSLHRLRAYHTATLLKDGRVLVAGGFCDSGANSEIYDPATGNWTEVSALSQSRAYHTATLLADGKVLVAGGQNYGGTALSSSELYDPVSDTWTDAIAPGTDQTGWLGRTKHSATLLPDGKVLVVGGITTEIYPDLGINYHDMALLYNPAAMMWEVAKSPVTQRKNHTATLLPNGKVLVAGGEGSGVYTYAYGEYLTSAQLYDPAANTWSPAGSLNVGRTNHTATLLNSGKVLVAAGKGNGVGSNDRGMLFSAEVYDPAANEWRVAGNLGAKRVAHAASVLSSGKVLLSGGVDGTYLASVELYDGQWNSVQNLITNRMAHAIAQMKSPDDRVLVAGGFNENGDVASAELFNPATKSWSPAGALNVARRFAVAATLKDGRVLVAGGYNTDVLTNQVYHRELGGIVTGTDNPVMIENLKTAEVYNGTSWTQLEKSRRCAFRTR